MVALDADTGKLKWHFQFTPHDEFDYDATQVPVLADIQWQGRPRKVMLWANRNGYLLRARPHQRASSCSASRSSKVNWASGLDAKGRPTGMLPPTDEGTLISPGNQGGTNWYSPSFSPRTGLFYIPTWVDTYSMYVKQPVEYVEGQRFTGARPVMPVRLVRRGQLINRRQPEEGYGAVRAIDPKTGELKWEFKMTESPTPAF